MQQYENATYKTAAKAEFSYSKTTNKPVETSCVEMELPQYSTHSAGPRS